MYFGKRSYSYQTKIQLLNFQIHSCTLPMFDKNLLCHLGDVGKPIQKIECTIILFSLISVTKKGQIELKKITLPELIYK